MLVRAIRIGLIGLLMGTLAGYGTAFADNHEGGDDNPCGEENPCDDGTGEDAGGEDDGAADTGGGDDMAAEGMMGPPPLVLGKGKLAIGVDVGVNLSADAVAKPFSIAPDVWFGVAPKLAAGLVHSGYGVTGFWGSVGQGLCLAGEENGCANVYSNFGLFGEFGLMDEGKPLSVALRGGLNKPVAFLGDAFDPLILQLVVGAKIRYIAGKIMVVVQPQLAIGVTERDFNKEILTLPASVGFMASDKLGVAVQTGINAPLDGFGDFFQIPVAAGAHFMVNPNIMVGGAFTFFNLAGKNSTADARGLNIFFAWMN
jgi:hypothetical protein